MKIGVDFGGVLHNYADNSDKYSVNMLNAKSCLKLLKKCGFHLFIISHTSEEGAKKVHQSLVDNKMNSLFTEEYYVKEWEYKKYICQFLGCHFMIDDREDVLLDIQSINHSLVAIQLKGLPSLTMKPTLNVFLNWIDICKFILKCKFFIVRPRDSLYILKYLFMY